MLVELSVRDLGVIADLRLVLGTGLTAVTGETGAGKTLVVTAIELLLGGRVDASVVRAGADEAWVEGRFVDGDREVVLSRAVPASGRSRAYIDGRMATAAALAEAGATLIDIHGQHEHQGLLAGAAQRRALDEYADVDHGPRDAAKARLAEIDFALAAIGGDERARAREIDLLRFQVSELDQAAVADPDEDERLAQHEAVLADAVAHREAAVLAVATLTGETGADELVGSAVAAMAGRAPFAAIEERLRALATELADVARDLRDLGESLDEDPERLEAITQRRGLLHDLRRKYGETLAQVIDFHREAAARLADLESHEQRAEQLTAERARAERALADADAAIGQARRAAAPGLASAIESHLRTLAMPRARVGVSVGDRDPGDDVALLLAANQGSELLPLAKVASGGELARTLLAARLVLRAEAPTLIFDEVDAGIGGEAALAVGRSLARLATGHQVLVVTHLPQVAAFADHQVRVAKAESGHTTVATAEVLDLDSRVIELSRMLSGQPASATARLHAEELLASASQERGR